MIEIINLKLSDIVVYWNNGYLYVPHEATYDKIECELWEFIKLQGDYSFLEVLKQRPAKVVTKLPTVSTLKSYTINSQNTIILYNVNSSNVELVGYDNLTMKLYIKFLDSNIFYEYSNVTPDIWEAMQLVDSKGSFVHFFLKINEDQYPIRKLSNLDYIISHTPLANPGSPHPSGYLTGFSAVGILFK